MSSGGLLLPLGAGFIYACGAIAVKQSLGAGISGSWVNFFCNIALALLFQIFWFFPGSVITPSLMVGPAACGALFFLGQIATFRALSSGDISVATPLLGMKVILVALFTLFIIGRALPASWWLASLLASCGIALISYSPSGSHRRLFSTICWSLAAAALFALTDVLLQYWVPMSGYSRFAPLMFGVTGLLSFIYLPALVKKTRHCKDDPAQRDFTQSAVIWLAAGALLLSLQALGMYSAIGLYRSATMTNILYGSRCLWSVLLIWALGVVAGDGFPSDRNSSSVMGRRFAGALLLFAAMALVLR